MHRCEPITVPCLCSLTTSIKPWKNTSTSLITGLITVCRRNERMVALGLVLQKNQCHLLGFFFSKIKKAEIQLQSLEIPQTYDTLRTDKINWQCPFVCGQTGSSRPTCSSWQLKLQLQCSGCAMECWFMGCWIIWFLPSEWIPQWKGRRKNRNEIVIPLFWDLSSALFHRRAAGWAAWLGVMASVEFLSFLLRVLIGECSAMLRFSSVAKDWEVWPAPLHPVKTQGILCTAAAALLLETLTCCNFLVQKTENHQNTETISSTIILLTYLIKILAYWMLHCCNSCCVEWWYAKLPPKFFFLWNCVIVFRMN